MGEIQPSTQTFVDSAEVAIWSINWAAVYSRVYLLAPIEKMRLETLIWPL